MYFRVDEVVAAVQWYEIQVAMNLAQTLNEQI